MIRISIAAALAAASFSAAHAQDAALDRGDRLDAAEGVADAIAGNFYDTERGAAIAEELREAARVGAFSDVATRDELAEAMTARLREEDRHFAVMWIPADRRRPETDGEGRHDPSSEDIALMKRGNFGFQTVKVLPGNIGYIDLREFAPASLAAPTAIAALDFIDHTDAIIFDLRQNGGGAPSMVQFLISHFLDPDEDVLINTFVAANLEYPDQLRALSYPPAGARPDVPLYVLTSARTGSAGEAMPYHLKALERAVIVGERTYGAGNPGGMIPAGEGWAVFVSTGSARNPVTGTNWEGVGVEPDIAVPASDALNVAMRDALNGLIEAAGTPERRTELEWARETVGVETGADPETYGDLAGEYGERRIFARDGALYLQRGDRPSFKLLPLGEERFALEGLEGMRVIVERSDGGAVTGIAYLYADGRRTLYAQDGG